LFINKQLFIVIVVTFKVNMFVTFTFKVIIVVTFTFKVIIVTFKHHLIVVTFKVIIYLHCLRLGMVDLYIVIEFFTINYYRYFIMVI